MKKLVLTFGCVIISCLAFGSNSIENDTNVVSELRVSFDIYPAVATTENGSYMEDYSIGIEIHGQRSNYGSRIDKVVCGGRSVSFMPVYGENNKYSFTYGSYTYYFTF